MRNVFLIILYFSPLLWRGVGGEAFSQEKYNPNSPPNTFRKPDNPLYWKNRKPYAGYWQQDVYYNIRAFIDEKTDIIDGKASILYFNNSPDTLFFVYFHLYQKAFEPGSHFEDLNLNNKVKPRYGKYEKKNKTTLVEDMTITDNNGEFLHYIPLGEYDNTVLKVYLKRPLAPNGKLLFMVKFKTYFDAGGSLRRRMKMFNSYGYKHYDGVHWYPRIAVYDRKFGWETEQHLEKEFYGDFGTYEVDLDFASNFVVEATGTLQNMEEVLPDSLRKKLDISNFKDKILYSRPSVIMPYDSTQRKIWKFYAENVHDFAFTADPTYRIGEAEWNGIKCIAVCQEPHASRWQNAAEYTAKIIKTYSEDIGMYGYPKMVVADARDGMEYPMLTLDGGLDPGYRGLLAHEVGHNWFFGMVGNNETYRAFLDEGFTQFLTTWALNKIDGEYPVEDSAANWYEKKFSRTVTNRDENIYNRYLNDVVRGSNPPINVHSAGFGGALRHGGGYGHVYRKTATMLYNLQYVLGDELFLKSIKHYFNQWKFCHPYDEDFRNSIIQYTHVDLNWFFDQWINSSKEIDYSICSIRKDTTPNHYKIKFRRKGSMQMPIDFQVISKDNSRYDFHIPNTWFVKKTEATVLTRWFGWDNIHKTYTANVTVPGGIRRVTIDTSHRLADIDMMNNSTKKPIRYSFDSQHWEPSQWNEYNIKWRPDIWFNSYDGLKAGLHLNGNYMNHKKIFRITAWYNSGLGQGGLDNDDFGTEKNDFEKFSFTSFFKTPIDNFIPKSSIYFDGKMLDGVIAHQFGFEMGAGENDRIYAFTKGIIRSTQWDLNYSLYPSEWQTAKWNNTLNLGYEHNYHYFKGNGKINLDARNSAFNSDYNFGNFSITVINKTRLGKLFLHTRVFAQYGFARDGANESALYLAGASPEQMIDNKFTRSKGFIPNEWVGFDAATNHFQQSGGLNLRGYAGYYAVESDDDKTYMTYKGNSGAAVNVEIDFDDLIRFKPKIFRNSFKLDTYIFGDAGTISYETPKYGEQFSAIRMDAGIGMALTIKRFWKLQTVEPLVIRFDMPLILNRTPFVEPEYFKFRWVLGIGRSF